MSKLTSNTAIPLGLAVVAIGGGSVWLTTLHAKASIAVEGVNELKLKRDEDQRLLQTIHKELIEVKTIVGALKERDEHRRSR